MVCRLVGVTVSTAASSLKFAVVAQSAATLTWRVCDVYCFAVASNGCCPVRLENIQ